MKLLLNKGKAVLWCLVLVTVVAVKASKPKDCYEDDNNNKKTCSCPNKEIPSTPPAKIAKILFEPSILNKDPNHGVLKQLEGT